MNAVIKVYKLLLWILLTICRANTFRWPWYATFILIQCIEVNTYENSFSNTAKMVPRRLQNAQFWACISKNLPPNPPAAWARFARLAPPEKPMVPAWPPQLGIPSYATDARSHSGWNAKLGYGSQSGAENFSVSWQYVVSQMSEICVYIQF